MPTARRWFERADQYAANAQRLYDFDDREALVQLAQAAEYALKAVQIVRTGSHRRGHDLVGLSYEVDAPKEHHETLAYLEQAYARRYPDDERFEPQQFTVRYESVKELIAWARKQTTNSEANTGNDSS